MQNVYTSWYIPLLALFLFTALLELVCQFKQKHHFLPENNLDIANAQRLYLFFLSVQPFDSSCSKSTGHNSSQYPAAHRPRGVHQPAQGLLGRYRGCLLSSIVSATLQSEFFYIKIKKMDYSVL